MGDGVTKSDTVYTGWFSLYAPKIYRKERKMPTIMKCKRGGMASWFILGLKSLITKGLKSQWFLKHTVLEFVKNIAFKN